MKMYLDYTSCLSSSPVDIPLTKTNPLMQPLFFIYLRNCMYCGQKGEFCLFFMLFILRNNSLFKRMVVCAEGSFCLHFLAYYICNGL